ncbi:hypothetical protein FSP39_017304 [Pinctada imbricata]|uniref:3-phosphoinositide-dependent protein kinase 1 n=1 Tax=Pinctada imbricata TaxID=66713 RepID=A0AA88XSW3_PINIB|nr:hypothetical protein FSP39_017304 [Pinctada imbricata]
MTDISSENRSSTSEDSKSGAPPPKKTPNDFIFGKVIGEGSFSSVYLAKEVESGIEYAIKVLEKRHIMRERKTQDLKPENILLNDKMHIQITDFGSAKLLANSKADEENQTPGRTNSFVGTAQYVSPEVLTSKKAYYSSDLWALGCIVYQLLSGLPPFRGGHEYQIFQKITKLEYEFPDGFNSTARDLVEKLLVINPEGRLGCEEMGGYEPLKSHPFFVEIDWEHIHEQKPPELMPFLPATSSNPENIWSRPGFDDARLVELITQPLITEDERKQRLEDQAKSNDFHKYVEENLILKQGFVDKRKGLFARKRMLLLTEGPHLYYVDAANKVLKGQIPWSKELRPEAKNFKTFFVHTPNRTYYLEDRNCRAEEWVAKIHEVWQQYFGEKK